MERYKTVKVYQKSGRKITVNTGLTEEEAQKEVQKDIEKNPNSSVYMLVYYKQ